MIASPSRLAVDGLPGKLRGSRHHIDELADLFCLAIEQRPKGAMLHGVIDEVCQRDPALSISRMIGAGDHSECFTMNQMMGMTAGARIGLSLTKQGAESAEPTRAERDCFRHHLLQICGVSTELTFVEEWAQSALDARRKPRADKKPASTRFGESPSDCIATP